jgi:hypothetical protein
VEYILSMATVGAAAAGPELKTAYSVDQTTQNTMWYPGLLLPMAWNPKCGSNSFGATLRSRVPSIRSTVRACVKIPREDHSENFLLGLDRLELP